jgi:colicin import membrane protein
LQQHPDNDLYRFPSEKGKGIAGTIVIHLAILVLCLVFGFSVPPPPETEMGIVVNFGTDETGLGFIEPSAPAFQEEASPPPAAEPEITTDEEPILTQDNEEAPEVKKVDPEAERKRQEQLEAERIRREQLEAERIRKEQEEVERKRLEAEQQRQTEIMDRTRKALEGSKNAGTSSTSEGVAGGEGNQGVPSGDLNSQNRGEGGGTGNSGISYDLGGRGFQKLPLPQYDYQEEGKVVVEVSVDRSGKVIQAIPGIKGSSTLDEYLLKVAKEAALQAQFDPKPDAPLVQKGTITYNFVLK